MFSGVFDQVRLKLACSATEASKRLEILVTETRDITLSRQRTTKVLIRLRGFAGWSAPLLFAYDIRHVFSWPGSNEISWYAIKCACNIITCRIMKIISATIWLHWWIYDRTLLNGLPYLGIIVVFRHCRLFYLYQLLESSKTTAWNIVKIHTHFWKPLPSVHKLFSMPLLKIFMFPFNLLIQQNANRFEIIHK